MGTRQRILEMGLQLRADLFLFDVPEANGKTHKMYIDQLKKGRRFIHDYTEYVQFIDHFSDEGFDMVLVDGRARQACLIHGWPKVKIGGYLVLDNSNRKAYRHTLERNFRGRNRKRWMETRYEGLSRTTVWRRMGP